MNRRIAVLTFPGTNAEDETLRLLRDCGGDAYLVHWSRAEMLPQYDAYVLPGGFAYEDRIRAGAVAAFDPAMQYVIDAAGRGKMVLGICNGAQILLEAGLVPGQGELHRPTAAFSDNRPGGHFICRHVYVKLAVDPDRSPITAGLDAGAVVPAYASNGEGCLTAPPERLRALIDGDHVAFVYARADGTVDDAAVPNGSALGCAGLLNQEGNVLAIMPHPERDAWNFQHLNRCVGDDILAPSGGAVLFRSFVEAVNR